MEIVQFSHARVIAPATTWLRETYTWDNTWEMRVPTEQYAEQQRWWDSNGKTFPLLSLPPEMREAIYLQIVGPVVLPELIATRATVGRGLTDGGSGREGARRDPDIPKPNMSIMRVCKLVRREAMQVAFRDTRKRFRTLGSLSHSFSPLLRFMSTLSSHTSFLRTVQLEMSAAQYFHFFGVHPRRGEPLRAMSSRCSDMLTVLKALQELDLRFVSPKHKDAVCPWSLGEEATHSCQKIWIDWLFLFCLGYPSRVEV